MRSITVIIQLLTFTLCVFAAAAPEVRDSGRHDKYEAKFCKSVKGSVKFEGTQEGFVKVDVSLYNLPNTGGPFLYHVHQKPVPANGSCYATLEHLNPYNGSVNASRAADKEVGDLSGKHGSISGRHLQTSYIDPYLSLNKTDAAFIGNLSIVVHLADNTRIACANITSKHHYQ